MPARKLRRTISEVDYRTLYTSFAANAATGRPARPVFDAYGRTVQRDAVWQINGGRMLLVDTQLEGLLQTGEVQHQLLAGMDWQRNTSNQSNWRGFGPLGSEGPIGSAGYCGCCDGWGLAGCCIPSYILRAY